MTGDQHGNQKAPQAEQPQTSTPAPNAREASATSEVTSGVDQQSGSNTSERKKEANRENAKHSTGPKTERGKHAVRGNAVEHGFYATDAVMGEADGWEHTEEFTMLFDALKREWDPQGPTEESLVHTIAVVDWRLRRCYRSEVGEIRRAARSFLSRTLYSSVQGNPLVDTILPPGGQPNRGPCITAASVEGRLLLLSTVREQVECQGYVSAALQEELDTSFGRHASSFASRCYELSRMARRQQSAEERESSNPERERILRLLHPEGFKEEVSAEHCKQLLLREIDILTELARILHKEIEETEHRNTMATLKAHNIPPQEFVDKLVRYEGALERKKEKAIKLLLQLQQRRQN